MRSHRLLTLSPDNEPMWVRLYVQPIGDRWAAMIVGDTIGPPSPNEVEGMAFFADTADQAECLAKTYLGMAELAN
jgi:hypothetical protein